MNSLLKKIIGFCLVLLGFFITKALPAERGHETYSFPYVPPLEATIAGSFFKAPKDLDYETLKIAPLHNQKTDKLKLRYYPAHPSHKDKDELVFVFSGIGGNNDGNISNLLSHHLAKNGMHAVIVPSIFTEDFALSFSKTGYVGHMPKDAEDMMHALTWVYKNLKQDKGLEFDAVKLAGYSLGALSAAHVAHHADTHESAFNFKKVVLLNSPVDLLHGLRYLDRAEKDGTDLTVWRLIFGAFRPLIDVFFMFRDTEFITEEIFIDSVKELETLDEADLKALVAKSLKSSLSSVIMASQRLHELGVLPRLPTLRDDMRRRTAIFKRRLDAAKKMGFEEYVEKILVKYYREVLGQEAYDVERFNKESSLTAIEDYLKKASHIYFIHNTDDFLLKDSDEVEYIRKIFGPRAVFYPRGGHLGNIWFETNLQTFLNKIGPH